MPNYELGKIYKIEGNGLVCYGSTCAEYQKQYYEKNKETPMKAKTIYNYNKRICGTKQMCSDCGCVITNWSQHRNTQKHLNNYIRHQMIDEIALD